jgi:competence protein ComEC
MFPLKIFVIGGFFASGVLVGDIARPGASTVALVAPAGLALLGSAWWLHRRPPDPQPGEMLPRLRPLTAMMLVTGVAAVGFADMGLRAKLLAQSPLPSLDGRSVTVAGRLTTDPRLVGRSTAFTIGSLVHEGHPLDGKLAVLAYGRAPRLELGDRVRVEAKMRRLDLREPFDASLARKGVVGAAVTQASELKVISRTANPVLRWSNRFRARMERAASASLAEDEAGVVLGLVIGDERRISNHVEEDFRVSGLAHLTAVSGANVAMVLGALLLLMRALRFSRQTQIALSLLSVVIFAVITRWEPSVLRASVMATLALVAFFFGRSSTPSHALGLAFVGLLAVDPMMLWSIGFQLSFAATAGILWLRPLILPRLAGLPKPVAEATAIGIAAQLAVFPLIALHFGRVSILSVPANLAAFPLVAPATVVGLAAGAAAMISVDLAQVLMEISGVFVSILLGIARFFGRSTFAQVLVPNFNSTEILVAYLAIASGAMLLSGRARWARWPAVAAALLFLVASLIPVAGSSTPDGLRVTFFDVGEGDAALVESPSGARILIDGGRDPLQIAHALRRRGFERLDVVAASHLHADHVMGLAEVLRRFDVRLAVHPGVHAPLLATLQEAGNLEPAGDRESIQLGGITVDFLGPTADMRIAAESFDSGGASTTEGSVLNDSSLVLRIRWGSECVLFTGDLEEAGQQELLDMHQDRISCTIMKAPHHGSARLLPAFVEAVDPEWVAVSVGPNDYGHPTRKALSTFEGAGAKVLRTDRLDDIVMEMDQAGEVRLTG